MPAFAHYVLVRIPAENISCPLRNNPYVSLRGRNVSRAGGVVPFFVIIYKKTDAKVGLLFLPLRKRMVPVGGLEPPHPKAGDFESPMSTNSITLAFDMVSMRDAL